MLLTFPVMTTSLPRKANRKEQSTHTQNRQNSVRHGIGCPRLRTPAVLIHRCPQSGAQRSICLACVPSNVELRLECEKTIKKSPVVNWRAGWRACSWRDGRGGTAVVQTQCTVAPLRATQSFKTGAVRFDAREGGRRVIIKTRY